MCSWTATLMVFINLRHIFVLKQYEVKHFPAINPYISTCYKVAAELPRLLELTSLLNQYEGKHFPVLHS